MKFRIKEIKSKTRYEKTLELHKKFKEENPEKYEKIIKDRKEIFEKSK